MTVDWTSFTLGALAMLLVILLGYWLLNHQWISPEDDIA